MSRSLLIVAHVSLQAETPLSCVGQLKLGFSYICGPTHVKPHVDGTVWVHTRLKCPLARTRSPLALWSLAARPEAPISLVRQVCHAYSWSNVASNEMSCAFLGPPFLKPQLQHTSPFSQHGPNMLLVRDPPSGCSNCFRHRVQSDPSRIPPSKSHSPRYTISNKHDQNTPYFTNSRHQIVAMDLGASPKI